MMSLRAALRVLVLCAGVVVTSQSTSGQAIWYVDAKATGPIPDGQTWCTAFLDLQNALASAQAGDEIRVGAGTYKPGIAGNRSATFTLRSGVALRGGYAGCGAENPDARDYALHPAVLSGDLLGDDGPNFSNYADNSYHVVTYDNPAATGVLLEGFTVSSGNANGADAFTNQGGGIHIRQGLVKCIPGGPTIRDCIVENNWGTHHGAINDHGLSTVIENCVIRNNYSGHEGGGLQIHSGSPTVRNCQFINNKSAGQGGGAWVGFDTDATCSGGSAAKFYDCTFEGNVADTGGGLYAKLTTSLLVKNSAFLNNDATQGGGLFLETVNNATIDACEFRENEGFTEGGGAYNSLGTNIVYAACTFKSNTSGTYAGALRNRESSPLITGCVFVDNFCNGNGGALHNRQSNATFDRCAFLGNRANLEAGASFNTVGSNVVFKNSAFIGNHSARSGGVLSTYENSFPVLRNCTLHANTAVRSGTVAINDALSGTTFNNCIVSGHTGTLFSGNIIAKYSNIQGGLPGIGNVNVPPQFVDANGADNVFGTEDDDLRLTSASPGINVGDPAFAPAINEQDLGGGPRLAGCRVDMGAQETDAPQTAADFNDDKLLDLADFASFQLCFLSPAQNPGWRDACVCVFDVDDSEFVDLPDYAQLPWAHGPCQGNADCDDEDACNGLETCVAGICHGGTPLACDDESLCTIDSCEAGECTHTTALCDDDQPCTDDACDPVAGCSFTANDGNSCSDGDACNGVEYCGGGVCQAVPAPVCNDGKPCTDDSCNPAIGCVYTADDTNACGDNNVCNGVQACHEGECLVAPGLECNDQNPCTDDSCDPVSGCVFTNNDENACSDGDACDGEETCSAGDCVAGVALACEDQNPCTDDGCEPASGCVFTADDQNSCSDDDVCTVGDACISGNCSGEPVDCASFSTQCAVASCDANGAEGNCDTLLARPSGTPCDADGSACTIDACDLGGNCLHQSEVQCPPPLGECDGGQSCDSASGECVDNQDSPADTPCDLDESACTIDECDGSGACLFATEVQCPGPTSDCDGGQVCDPASGECVDNTDPGSETPCDLDKNACTIDQCDGSGACAHGGDVECAGAANECDGGQTCDSLSGECVDLADLEAGAPCDNDANLCTLDVCDGSGACVAETEVECPSSSGECDGGESCDPSSGECTDNADSPVGTACDLDQDICTEDKCDGEGTCIAVPACPHCSRPVGCVPPNP